MSDPDPTTVLTVPAANPARRMATAVSGDTSPRCVGGCDVPYARGAVTDIYDPSSYALSPPHEVFADLRRTDPVHWQAMPGGSGYWAILRHADVIGVARDPRVFSASAGGVVLEDLAPDQLAMMRHMLLAMDPPVHTQHRQPLAPSFGATVIARMEGQIRAICREILAGVTPGEDVDFVHAVCSR